jgi:hypothetical protein
MLFRGCLLGEGPGQHEFGLKHGSAGVYAAVQCCRHPFMDRMMDPPLNVPDRLTGITFVPAPVEVFGHGAELHTRTSDRSSGSTSPRFSRQRRTRPASSSPMMIRASEPPRNERRSLPDPRLVIIEVLQADSRTARICIKKLI